MPILLAEILRFQGSTLFLGVGSLRILFKVHSNFIAACIFRCCFSTFQIIASHFFAQQKSAARKILTTLKELSP